MKSNFFLSILIFIFSNTFSQKSHEKYSEEEVLILSNHILELEKNDSLYKELVVSHSALENELSRIRADQQHKIDSITNYFTIKITRLENSSRANIGASENVTSSKTTIDNANVQTMEVSNKITEDDIVVEKQMLEFLRNIHFDSNSFRIKESLAFKLDIVSDILKKFTTTRYQILAFTDTIGDKDYNLELSKKRAAAVKNYLVSSGIASNRLVAIGLGEELPKPTRNKQEASRESRRAELRRIYASDLTKYTQNIN